MPRIVFRPVGVKPIMVSKAHAIELLKRGAAKITGKHEITATDHPAMTCPVKCGQAVIYESAASLNVRQFLNGGLTRTETQPQAFSIAKGARVSH